MTGPLISVDELAGLLVDPAVRVVDVRWYLGEPLGGRTAYETGHLPGALFADLDRDLSAAEGPGRHPLPDRERFAATLGGMGIGDRHVVVGYDDRGGAIAARLWWMLRDIGHEAVRVLDGGIGAWVASGRALDTSAVSYPPAAMTVRPPITRQIDRHRLRTRLGNVTLLDARDPERYRGEVEPVDPAAGHIPTAVSAPVADNLDSTGRFLPPDLLAARYRSLGDTDEVVVYCGSGVTACHHALAMQVAGLPEPTLYPGSWSDWSQAGMEVAVGPDPGGIA